LLFLLLLLLLFFLLLPGHFCALILISLISSLLLREDLVKDLFLAVEDLLEEPCLLPLLHGALILVDQEGFKLGLLEAEEPRFTRASAALTALDGDR